MNAGKNANKKRRCSVVERIKTHSTLLLFLTGNKFNYRVIKSFHRTKSTGLCYA